MSTPVTGVELGFAIGAVPTFSMALASAIMSNMEVSPATESMVQYFASGLILAAVALELFPLLRENVTPRDSMVGITVGMFVGLVLVYGMEYVMSLFEEAEDGGASAGHGHSHEKALVVARERTDSLIKSFGVNADDVEVASTEGSADGGPSASYSSAAAAAAASGGGMTEAAPLGENSPLRRSSRESTALMLPRMLTSGLPSNDIETMLELKKYKAIEEDVGEWNDDDVAKSHEAILNPQHRSHVYEHLKEIADQVNEMETRSILLMDSDKSSREQEEIAELIDEGVHKLQYLLDHSRRLVEGAESEITGASPKVCFSVFLFLVCRPFLAFCEFPLVFALQCVILCAISYHYSLPTTLPTTQPTTLIADPYHTPTNYPLSTNTPIY